MESRIWIQDDEVAGGFVWHWWINAGKDPWASVETGCGLSGLTISRDELEEDLEKNRFASKCPKCKTAAESWAKA